MRALHLLQRKGARPVELPRNASEQAGPSAGTDADGRGHHAERVREEMVTAIPAPFTKANFVPRATARAEGCEPLDALPNLAPALTNQGFNGC